MADITRGDCNARQHPKPRPALVVSIDPINDLLPDVLVIPITSVAGPLRVPIPDVAAQTGLNAPSHAKCESLGPIHKSRLKQRIGSLPRETWPAVETELKRVLGIRD